MARSVKGSSEGLRSEALQLAFKTAIAGQPAELQGLLCRYGGLPGPRPNFKLAAAFGAELRATEQRSQAAKLLARLAAEPAPAESARAFLPIAAAHGYCAYLQQAAASKERELSWSALAALAMDARLPVRQGLTDALTTLCAQPGAADALIERAQLWLDDDDREQRFGTGAAVLAVLGPQSISGLRDHAAALEYVSRVIAVIADAPRSAERSEARRRALLVLPQALYTLVPNAPGEHGAQWLLQECERASHPQLREALSSTIVRLQKDAQGLGRATIEALRKALEASAAPLRDGVVIRPGTGRGKAGRRIR